MKIYFSGSIRGGRDDSEIYHQIITYLKKFGEVLTEHIGDSSLDSFGEKSDDISIHNKDMEFLMACDLVVAEVTNPSLGVGYEIGRAIENNKKVHTWPCDFHYSLGTPELVEKFVQLFNH